VRGEKPGEAIHELPLQHVLDHLPAPSAAPACAVHADSRQAGTFARMPMVDLLSGLDCVRADTEGGLPWFHTCRNRARKEPTAPAAQFDTTFKRMPLNLLITSASYKGALRIWPSVPTSGCPGTTGKPLSTSARPATAQPDALWRRDPTPPGAAADTTPAERKARARRRPSIRRRPRPGAPGEFWAYASSPQRHIIVGSIG
jgi:hypothetical protein